MLFKQKWGFFLFTNCKSRNYFLLNANWSKEFLLLLSGGSFF